MLKQFQHVEKFSASNSRKGSTRHLSPSNHSHEHGGKHGEGKALIPDSHNVHTETNFERNRPANSAQRDMSYTSFSFCKTRRAQNPSQPRFLSTSYISWHTMSRAIWQLKATFATSQSCRKRAILSQDPCSPMTNNASLPTLLSSELLDDTEEPFSDSPEFYSIIMCRPIKAHAFTASTEMLGPNRTNSLRTIGSFFRRKKKSSQQGP